jgi:creatinine amidohydrolase
MSIHLQELNWLQVAEYLKHDDRIIIPVGSTEQHGRFAPLGTDTYVAMALAEEAGGKSGVLVAPPVWTGWSPHHLVQPGTISIRAEVLIELLFDIIRSLAEHGFAGFLVVNGHRVVNISWMQISAERAQRELKVRVALFDPAWMSREFTGFSDAIGHGEEIEISHMLHCFPHLIDLRQARDNPAEERELYHVDPADSRDSLCYVPATREDMGKILEKSGDTITGRPTKAAAEKGRAYHEHLTGRLLRVLEQMRKEKS